VSLVGSIRRAIRRTGQALLCASAVAGGAALAHHTHSEARAAESVELGVFAEAPEPALTAVAPRVPEPEVWPDELAFEEPSLPSIEPVAPFAESLRDGMVITGRTPHRLILFTFDDGPDPRYTPRLLDRLDEVGVKAVFFLTASRIAGPGPWQLRNQEIAREIVRRGHVVGNHTVDHEQLPLLDDQGVLAQVRGADEIFARVLGERTWLVRPPGGARSARVDALLAQHGYTQVVWNLGSGDFQVRTADEVLRIWRRVLERRERDEGDRGGIVLLHDTHEWSVDAFPRMVSWLRERNCELLADGEELYDIVSDPALFHALRDASEPSAEAPPAAPAREILEERQRAVRAETARRCERLALQ
jgi:peptidoglycan-N-acetylglucosamine deacetylase